MLGSIVVLVCSLPALLHADRISIEDENGNNCILAPVGGESTTIHIIAEYADLAVAPSVEFRITGMPPDWLVSVTPNPLATVSNGDPFGEGNDMTFPVCDPGENNRVLLFTVEIAPTTREPVTLVVEAHSNPPNPGNTCPLILDCMVFSKHCLPTGPAGFINGGDPLCEISVLEETWSRVKSLYQ